MVKNLPTNAGDTGDVGSVPELETYSGGGNGTPPWWSLVGYSPRGCKELDITDHARKRDIKDF